MPPPQRWGGIEGGHVNTIICPVLAAAANKGKISLEGLPSDSATVSVASLGSFLEKISVREFINPANPAHFPVALYQMDGDKRQEGALRSTCVRLP